MIWADICNQTLYGHWTQKFFRAPASKVKLIDQANICKYMEWELSRYKKEDIVTKFEEGMGREH